MSGDKDKVEGFFKKLKSGKYTSKIIIILLILNMAVTGIDNFMEHSENIWYRLFPKKGPVDKIKADAEQLSYDIFEFIGEREKIQPEWNFGNMTEYRERYDEWHTETIILFNQKFSARISELVVEFKQRGLETSNLEFNYKHVINTLMIEEIAHQVLDLANQLPKEAKQTV